MIYKVALALQFCHNNRVLHKDVKLENIMIDKNSNISLIDFGYSEKIPRSDLDKFRCCGTPNYLPPEFILQNPSNGNSLI